VLELKEKVAKRGSELAPDADSAGRELPEEAVLDDVLSALVNLGYKDVQVRKVLADLDTQADASVEQVLKQALKILMR
jgi:Holliday junction DNA helicase RuvA